MAPLHHQLTSTHDFGAASDIGFNYGGLSYGAISAPMGGADLNFHIGGGGGGAASLFMQQPPQFPFLPPGLDPSAGLFESGGGEGSGYNQLRPKLSSSGITHQMASVKMEDSNNHELNLSRQLLGIPGNDHHHHPQYWSAGANSSTNNAWTDLSGFSSSSTTSNPL